jgi:pyruvate formate lyase activating enzyme
MHTWRITNRRIFKTENALTAVAATAGDNPQPGERMPYTVEARFYERLPNNRIRCKLCPHECVVGDGKRGHCNVRENRDGACYTLVYGRICAAHVDPIEKKPLFHYLPGTRTFSVATAGCNVHCKFCQNWNISQARPEQVRGEYLPPGNVAELAAQYSCPTIAFTYGEPVVFSEFAMDTADAGHAAGIRSIVVSNGYIQDEPLRSVYGKMDAVKIDLKSFSEYFYRKAVAGRLKPVLDSLVTLRGMGKWTEIVYLVVPTLNDSDQDLCGVARWVATHLGPDVPLHFTQYHPAYLLKNAPGTPVATLERAKAIADAEGLHYVYIGNIRGHQGENTYCPQCGRMLVERAGFAIRQMLIRNGMCPFCMQVIPGVWS